MTRPLFRRSLVDEDLFGCQPEQETSLDRLAEVHRLQNRFNVEPDPKAFYLSATPRVRRLNHLLTKEAPGDHPGSRTPSRISDGLHLIGHVARRSSLQRTAVRPKLPFGRSFQNPGGF